MWYYVLNNQRFGPVDEGAIANLLANNTLTPQALVWQEGMSDWMPLQNTALGRYAAVAAVPPPYAPAAQMPPAYQPVYAPVKVIPEPVKELNTLFMWSWILMIVGVVTSWLIIGIFAMIASIVLVFILLYRFWLLIQDGNPRATAREALGFCFIPFYQYYWIFHAFGGLAEDLNTYTQARSIQAPLANKGLATAFCILYLCSLIPYVGFLTGIAAVIILFILFANYKNVAAAIIESRQ